MAQFIETESGVFINLDHVVKIERRGAAFILYTKDDQGSPPDGQFFNPGKPGYQTIKKITEEASR